MPKPSMDIHNQVEVDIAVVEWKKIVHSVEFKRGSEVKSRDASYIIYCLETDIRLPNSERKRFSVSRRFSDFLELHQKLLRKYYYGPRPKPEEEVALHDRVC
jgi:hypothetical protein